MLRESRFSLSWMAILATVPVALIAAGKLGTTVPAQGTFREVLWSLPYVFYGVTAFLGARMNLWQVVFSAGLFAAAYYAGWFIAFPLQPRGQAVAEVTAVALPASVLAILFIPQQRLFGREGLKYLAAILGPAAVLSLIQLAGNQAVLGWVFVHHLPGAESWRLPWLGVVLLLPMAASIALHSDRYLREYHAALVIAFLPMLYALNRATAPGQGSQWYLASAVTHVAAGLILLYGIYRLYWRKVYIDELTGLPNRRSLDERLKSLSGGYFIAMGDIDHFKKFNDQYGHDQGDHVLRYVARQLEKSTRGRAYRYGGEEFCIVCTGMSAEEALKLVQGARENVGAREFFIRAAPQQKAPRRRRKGQGTGEISRPAPEGTVRVRVTMSFGLDCSSALKPKAEQVLLEADQLLYKAKEKGRDCVVASF